MEISEFVKKKAKLEARLLQEINTAFEKFRNETGYSPYSIYVRMVDVTTLKDITTQYMISDVQVEIPLEAK